VDLARAAAALQRLSWQPLKHADLVRILQAAGWRITDADLQRAIRATKTSQGTQTANGKATTPSAPRPPIPTQTAASPSRSTVSPVVRAERNDGRTEPKPSSAEASLGEIRRRPVDDAERVAMQTTLQMSKSKVAPRALKQRLPARAASDTTAKATRWDRHLANEVASMRSKSTQRLSDSEVVRRLRSAGWQVTEANLQRAIRPITIERATTYRKQGEPAKSGKPSRRPPSMEVRIDNSVCDACGAAVSANGYCGCS
jgi:arginine repressor